MSICWVTERVYDRESLTWSMLLHDVCACVTLKCVCCSSGPVYPWVFRAQWRILGPVTGQALVLQGSVCTGHVLSPFMASSPGCLLKALATQLPPPFAPDYSHLVVFQA